MAATMYAPGFPNNNLPTNLVDITGRGRSHIHDVVAAAVIGAAAGATATRSVTRQASVGGNNESRAGLVPMEVVTLSRVTTTADVANVKSELKLPRPTLAFPADLSGNGGKAFTRT